jgi:hypothetical protein
MFALTISPFKYIVISIPVNKFVKTYFLFNLILCRNVSTNLNGCHLIIHQGATIRQYRAWYRNFTSGQQALSSVVALTFHDFNFPYYERNMPRRFPYLVGLAFIWFCHAALLGNHNSGSKNPACLFCALLAHYNCLKWPDKDYNRVISIRFQTQTNCSKD